MEEGLRALVSLSVARAPYNTLTPAVVSEFCTQHGVPPEEFHDRFARFVACEFAKGELSYADADCVINDLAACVGPDMHGVVLRVYHAFDSGEYLRPQDAEGTIPWQKYTLPQIMALLTEEGWLG
ncbi:hypothetical protein GLA29479_3672 [Lysobacter antibioticus]|uniref:hypothetical protein n=1 Tax=Lysobacter antibioticus TaxID=84531 RepID=UPI00072129CF|nr:hypothetical protein [Lysobacter antibioticus]ALN64523.1 hypothetical protein GLA29479_3672 [Lysobacter antibioticus]